MFYNHLISSYGTHYTSSVIVGGVIEMFTYVNSEYQKLHSRRSIEKQIAIAFGYQKYEMSGSTDADSSIPFISEDFKRNSQMNTKFSPHLTKTPETDKTPRDIWLEQTLSTPVIINRTLSPLVDLLNEYPIEIRYHLQLTIDYYLKNGKVPTIGQLSSAGQLQSRTGYVQNILPGSDVVGCGFDIFTLTSKYCLLDLTMNYNTMWTDVFNNYTTYKVPDGYYVTNNKDMISMFDTKFFDTLKTFVSNSYIHNRHDSFGFLGFGASSSTTDIRIKYSRFYRHKYRMAWTKQQLTWYTLTAMLFPRPPFNMLTSLAVANLPKMFNPKSADSRIFKRFFDAYGTHFVIEADMGGMLWAEDYFESCLITRMTEQWVRREIVKRYWFFRVRRTTTINYHKEVDKEYRQNSLSRLKIIGGSTTVTPLTGENWLPTVKLAPAPVTYRLQPIYTLLPRGAQREALKEATFYFRSLAVNQTDLYIRRLETETTPPPLPQLVCS